MSDEPQIPLDDLKTKCDEAMAGWKRALADYDNVKKDLVRERAAMRREANLSAAHSFLAVLDNFDQALKHVPDASSQMPDAKLQSWLSGILFIRTQLETALRDLGLEPFGAVGETFDPNLHDASSEREEAGKPAGQILDVVRRGWKMSDRVVQSASVVVSK